MRQSKYIVPLFRFYERTAIETVLEDQARKGWMLESIGYFAWKFRRAEPKNVHYAVTYLPGLTGYEPEPTPEEDQLRDFCAHAGWTPAASGAQLQIFQSEQPDPVPIETDPLVERKTIHRAMKKTVLPVLYIIMICSLLPLVLLTVELCRELTDTLSSSVMVFGGLGCLVMLSMALGELISYYLWRRRGGQAVRRNSPFVKRRSPVKLQLIGALLLMACCIGMVLPYGWKRVVLGVISVLLYAGIMWVGFLCSSRLKKKGCSKEVNRSVYFAVVLVLMVVINISLLGTGIQVPGMDWTEAHIGGTYDESSGRYTPFNDPVPLEIEMLTGEEGGTYIRYATKQSSPLLSQITAQQWLDSDDDASGALFYAVLEVKASWLYDACLRDYMARFGGVQGEYVQTDPEPWGAEMAYQLVRSGEERQRYLLCYRDTIVHYQFSQEPTGEQMTLVGEVLGN